MRKLGSIAAGMFLLIVFGTGGLYVGWLMPPDFADVCTHIEQLVGANGTRTEQSRAACVDTYRFHHRDLLRQPGLSKRIAWVDGLKCVRDADTVETVHACAREADAHRR